MKLANSAENSKTISKIRVETYHLEYWLTDLIPHNNVKMIYFYYVNIAIKTTFFKIKTSASQS